MAATLPRKEAADRQLLPHPRRQLHPLMHKAQSIPLCRVQVCRRLGSEGGEGITPGLSREGKKKTLCSHSFLYTKSKLKDSTPPPTPQVGQFPPVQGTCTETTAASPRRCPTKEGEKLWVTGVPKGLMNPQASPSFPRWVPPHCVHPQTPAPIPSEKPQQL